MKSWRISYFDRDDKGERYEVVVVVNAESFDDALAIARQINPKFNIGQLVEV